MASVSYAGAGAVDAVKCISSRHRTRSVSSAVASGVRTGVEPNNSIESILVCPVCKASIAGDGSSYTCAKCEKSYFVQDGILALTSKSTALGEFSNEEMRELLRAAEDLGWQKALATHVKPKNPAVLDLILDPRRSSFLDLLPYSAGGIAVDIGCGYGGISLQLARKYRRVFSLDSGLERLGFLNVIRKQENIDNIQAIHHENASSLPFADDSVDLLVMVGVFEYLPLAFPEQSIRDVQHRVLSELHRVLKTGGHLYIGTKNRFGWPYWKGSADHNRLPFGPILPRALAGMLTRSLYNRPYRIIVDSLPAYRRLLRDAGFVDARVYWPQPGYQFPQAFVPLNGDAHEDRGPTRGSSPGALKRHAVASLQALGILKYVVPHFSIVARKT